MVDDHLMGVTHVIRAEEWINSLPKHVMLYDAFGWERPRFIHMPLLRNKDRSKISKRRNPVDIEYYKKIGVLPQALLNFLGLMGYSMPDGREVFTLEEFVKEFDINRVSLGGPVFDLEKLMWLNAKYIRGLSQDELLGYIQEYLYSKDRLEPIIPLIQERIRTLGDFAQATTFFFTPAVEVPVEEVYRATKKRDPKETAAYLARFLKSLEEVNPFDTQTLETHMRDFAAKEGLKTREFFMVVRLAVTGRKASPPLIETMVVLGRAWVAQRLRAAIEAIRAFRPQER